MEWLVPALPSHHKQENGIYKGQNIWSSCFRCSTTGVLSRQERKQTGGTSLSMAQREEAQGSMARSVSWENWIHSLGRLMWLKCMGTCTGEEGANQGRVQKSAWVPLSVLLNSTWTDVETAQSQALLESSKLNISQTSYRNRRYCILFGIRDLLNPWSIQKDHNLVKEVNLPQSKGYSKLSLINLRGNPQKDQINYLAAQKRQSLIL